MPCHGRIPLFSVSIAAPCVRQRHAECFRKQCYAYYGYRTARRGPRNSTRAKLDDGEEGENVRERKQEERRQKEIEKDFNPEDFSLATAVALGCCSFEAYNAPYKSYGLKEVSPCGTETIFMDRDFLSYQICGMLEIHVRRAIDLPCIEQDEKGKRKRTKRNSLPNTRCTIKVHPSTGITDTYEHSTDPLWRETFFLYIRDVASQTIEITVEAVTDEEDESNICIGNAEIRDLKDICDGKVHNISVQLKRSEGSRGSLELSVKYQKHSKEGNLLGNIKAQAVGQMMTDDWSNSISYGWDNIEADFDWRFSGFQAEDHKRMKAVSDEEPIDIEGGQLAEGQPLDREPWKQWSSLRDAVIGRKLFSDLTPLVFLVNKQSDTEVWIYRSTEKKQIVISFRGTASPKDMLTDMALDLATFDPASKKDSRSPDEVAEGMSEEDMENGPLGGLYKGMKALEKVPGVHLINQVIKRKAKKTGGRSAPQGLSGWAKAQMMMIYAIEHDEMWCHKGFLQAYESVSKVIMHTVDKIIQDGGRGSGDEQQERGDKSWLSNMQQTAENAVGKLQSDGNWHIYATGHSMGGALATLCAHELAVRDYGFLRAKPKVTMYSFGQPRVGNGPFAKTYDETVPDSWRVKNADDMVTRVPSLLGYQHIGCEVNLFPHGKVSISGVSTDDVREGAVLTDILPKIKEGILGEDKELQSEFQQLVKGEIELFKAIVKGQGVNQHMEDMYHNYLQGCSEYGEDFCKPALAAIEDAKREAKEHKQKN